MAPRRDSRVARPARWHRIADGRDKALLRVFLEACDWPVDRDFPHMAVGLAQHHTMDVFEPLAALLPLRDIATLDDLATELLAA